MSQTEQDADKSHNSIPKDDTLNETNDNEEKAAGEEHDGGEKGSQHSGEGEGGAENVLSDEALALKQELDQIQVVAPTVEITPSEIFDPAEFPESYKENSRKEKLALGYAENFRRQYVYLYRDRKPLLLNPVNECGVEKFVCTTIRPTRLPYKQLYNWDGAAEFVSDYLNFKALEPSFELPSRLLSPQTVIKRQKGNCFEYSTVLCSFLVAVGYDAYVVSGYASRETCLMDETRTVCPLLVKRKEVIEEAKRKETKKYTVKPPKDLRSKFELKMEDRRVKAEKDAEQAALEEQERLQEELEKPPPDELLGMRVHSWVLILEGKREVPESFFIEPLTGVSHSLKDDRYHGIESIWNHKNYWVNMQDCSEGVADMKYDLGDCTLWEYMFPTNDKPQLVLPDEDNLDDDEENIIDLEEEEEEEDEDEIEKHLDVPPSWCQPIDISLRDFQMRCPMGKKTKLYKRAKLEKFAPYLLRDGLVSKLGVYEDRELTDLVMTKEYFDNRHDKLVERNENQRTGWITEFFKQGRHKHLKEHLYKGSSPGIESDRTMHFYHHARVDGLQKRNETPTYMEEHFLERDDFLYFRSIEFAKRPKKFGPADSSNANARPILKMVERYHRNRDKPANEDIAEVIFNISEIKGQMSSIPRDLTFSVKDERDAISVTYHTEDSKISASTREFLKPLNSDEKGAVIIWQNDMHQTFQVDPDSPDKKKVQLYQILLELIMREERLKEQVRRSEAEVANILETRTREEAASELDISVYDTDRNEKAKKHRAELERLEEEERKRRTDLELDYLAPFLAQIGDPEKLTRKQAYQLKEDCLADLKQRLIDKANLIQARFEKETQELQRKQTWYQQNQVSMQKDDEEAYLAYCSEAMFRINILELRLNRHKEQAPQKYMALEQKIRSDPRFVEFF